MVLYETIGHVVISAYDDVHYDIKYTMENSRHFLSSHILPQGGEEATVDNRIRKLVQGVVPSMPGRGTLDLSCRSAT